MFAIPILAIGFLILIKGADFLVNGSCVLAKKLHVSNLIIGLTVVAFGTSAPELFVNITASLDKNVSIAIGNIIGSNIFNILLIAGMSAVIMPLSVTVGTVWKEIPFSLLATIALAVLANDVSLDGDSCSVLSRTDGCVLILFFLVFMYYIISIARQHESFELEQVIEMGLVKSLIYVAIGFIALFFGSKLVVSSAVALAATFGISQSFIGLTIVSAGTSLPELATSAVAAYRKNSELAVGNIVGSNIFNIFFILGISSIISPLPLAGTFNFDLFVLTVSSVLLFIFMFTGKKHVLDRWEGWTFLIAYIAYVLYLIKRG